MKLNNLFFSTIVMFLAVSPARAFYVQEDIKIQTGSSCFYNSDEGIDFKIFGIKNKELDIVQSDIEILGWKVGERQYDHRVLIEVAGGVEDTLEGPSWVKNGNYWVLEEETTNEVEVLKASELFGVTEIIVKVEYQRRMRERRDWWGNYPDWGEVEWGDWNTIEEPENIIRVCNILINPVLPLKVN